MKEKLKSRLKFIEEAIAKQQASMQQAMADLNVLHGHKTELNMIIAMAEADAKVEAEQPVEAVVVDECPSA